MNELSPLDMLERILRRWWILAALMVLGGMAGWVFSLFRDPVYEATAVYQVSLDEQQLVELGRLSPEDVPLEFSDQNIFLSPVAALFYDPAVLANLPANARSQNIQLEDGDLDLANFYLDRRGTQWFVTVRSADLDTAVQLADLWLATVDAAARVASAHSAQYISLQLQHNSVQKCFAEMDFQQANQCAGTSFAAPADLDTYLNELETQMTSEEQAGSGIDPVVSFFIVSQAETPSHPVLYSVSLLMVAGSLIGLLAGMILVQVLKPMKAK